VAGNGDVVEGNGVNAETTEIDVQGDDHGNVVVRFGKERQNNKTCISLAP